MLTSAVRFLKELVIHIFSFLHQKSHLNHSMLEFNNQVKVQLLWILISYVLRYHFVLSQPKPPAAIDTLRKH